MSQKKAKPGMGGIEAVEREHSPANGVDPMYRVIGQQLLESIAEGHIAPGSRLPNGDDLARQYGTSINTVTRAMRLLSDEGLVRRVPGLGTFVSHANEARGRLFAFVGPRWRGLSELCALGMFESAFRRRLSKAGDDCRGVAWLHESDDQRTHEFLRELRGEGEVDGVFFVPPEGGLPNTERCLEEMLRLERAGVPVVLLDRDVVEPPGRSEFDVVSLNNQQAGFMLGRHLAECGARRALFAVRGHVPAVVAERLAGLRAGLSMVTANGDPARGEVRVAEITTEPLRHVIQEFQPDAMIGKDDALAATLMQVAYELHVRIPDDVMVAGFDDTPVAADMVVPLTSVRHPIEEIVDSALVLMNSRLASPDLAGRCVSLNGTLSVRRSTKAEV